MAEEAGVGTTPQLCASAHIAASTADLFDSVDYTLSNPDTLTKYKTAAQIGQKVLETVSGG